MAHYGKNNQYTLLLGDHRKHKQNKTQFMRFFKGDFISFKLLSIPLHLQHISAGGVFWAVCPIINHFHCSISHKKALIIYFSTPTSQKK